MNKVQELIAKRPGFTEMKPSNQKEAIKINDFIYMSQGTSNSYMLVLENSRIIINTGMGFEAINHKRIFDAVCDLPTSHILLTQGHVDHVGGVRHFREAGTQVIAQADNGACQHDDERIQTVRVSQSGIWFQHVFDYALEVAADHPDAFVQDQPVPDVRFQDSYSFEAGNLKFNILGVPGGETVDSCVVWLAEHGILFSGNTFGPLFPHFPNINTIRGDKYRHLEPYLESVAKVRELEPTLLITGHFDPIEGKQLIRDSLDQLEQAADYVYRTTLQGMNEGKDIFTLMREIQLPANITVGQGYGKVSWAVRTIWESYMGWFKAQSTTELYPTQTKEIYTDLVELAGIDAIVQRGQAKLDANDPEAALHLAEIAVTAEPLNRAALQLSLDTHNALRSRVSEINFWEDGWLKSQIRQLEQALAGS